MKAIVILAITAAALVFCSCDRHKWEDTKDPETGKVLEKGTKRLFLQHGDEHKKGEEAAH